MDATQWTVTGLAIFGALFALYRWIVSRNDHRRTQVNNAQDRTLEEHGERLDRHAQRLEKLDDTLKRLSTEIHDGYAKLDHVGGLETKITHELEKVHERLSSIARDLNQTIGTLRANHESEITHLITEISRAIGKSHE